MTIGRPDNVVSSEVERTGGRNARRSIRYVLAGPTILPDLRAGTLTDRCAAGFERAVQKKAALGTSNRKNPSGLET